MFIFAYVKYIYAVIKSTIERKTFGGQTDITNNKKQPDGLFIISKVIYIMRHKIKISKATDRERSKNYKFSYIEMWKHNDKYCMKIQKKRIKIYVDNEMNFQN